VSARVFARDRTHDHSEKDSSICDELAIAARDSTCHGLFERMASRCVELTGNDNANVSPFVWEKFWECKSRHLTTACTPSYQCHSGNDHLCVDRRP
jgi:hypothetical protein